MKKDDVARQRRAMQNEVVLQVYPTNTAYEITILALEGTTVSGATWSEALVKAREAIGQVRDAEAREILAGKRQRKAGSTQHTGKTVA